MISTLSLASEITLGVHLIKTMVSLYRIMFVVTFNAGVWNNLTSTQISKLKVVQLKFLKRILHSPPSTTNCFIYRPRNSAYWSRHSRNAAVFSPPRAHVRYWWPSIMYIHLIGSMKSNNYCKVNYTILTNLTWK